MNSAGCQAPLLIAGGALDQKGEELEQAREGKVKDRWGSLLRSLGRVLSWYDSPQPIPEFMTPS